MLVFLCPGCERRLTIQKEFAGRNCKCPHCGRVAPVVPQAIPSLAGQTASLPGAPAAPLASIVAAPEPQQPRAAFATDNAAPNVPKVPGYELLEELGRGGMGVVYKARHVRLKRLVALKMILSGAHAGPNELARFRIESEAVARLQHPNIVQIHEVGEHDGRPYFSLEYVDGGSLAQKLDGTPLPPRAAAQMVEKLARAIHAAHQRGIVHRDLKPANVLLTSDGQPKITDFGLAKRLDESEAPTRSGAIVGTASYMAPEQALGQNQQIGPAADIYSLGTLLYEMLTGRPPFKGATAMDTVIQVMSEEPLPPSQLQAKLPLDPETICLKCLRKEPSRRYASAEELAEDLRRYLAGEPILARPAQAWERAWKWARRRPAQAALLGFAALLVLGIFVGGIGFAQHENRQRRQADQLRDEAVRSRSDAENARLEAVRVAAEEVKARHEVDKARKLSDKASARSRRESADLALERGLTLCDQGEIRAGLLWLARSQELAPADAVELQRAARVNLALWSRHVHELKLTVAHSATVQALAISSDGKMFASGGGDRLVQCWDAATGQPVGEPLPHPDEIRAIAFSPNGQMLATAHGERWQKKPAAARLWQSASGKPIGQPLQHQGTVYAVAFRPDGKVVLTGSHDQSARLWDAATGRPLGEAMIHQRPVFAVAFSPDGKLCVTGTAREHDWGGSGAELRFWDAASGKPAGQPIPQPTEVRSLAWSLDGQLIATCGDPFVRFWNVARRQEDGPSLRHRGNCWSVAFSPNGRFLVTAGQDYKIRLWNVDKRQALGPPLHFPGWGQAVAFTSRNDRFLAAGGNVVQLWHRVADRPEQTSVDQSGTVQPMSFNADGTILVMSGPGNTARLWDTATGKPRGAPMKHPSGVTKVSLNADGRFALTSAWDGQIRLWDAPAGKLLKSFHHPEGIDDLAISPDGKWGLVGSTDPKARLWDATTGKIEVLAHENRVSSVGFSRDSKTCVTGTWSFQVRTWDVATAKEIGKPVHMGGAINAVDISPDGRRVLAGSYGDNAVRMGDPSTGRAIGPLMPHHSYHTPVRFSPDSKTLVTAEGNRARLWDAASGKPLGPPLTHTANVRALVFSADGQTVVSACENMTVRRYPLPQEVPAQAEQWVLWAQVRTGMSLDRYGSVYSLSAADWQTARRQLNQRGIPLP
jgi:WD40 repeat protein